MVLRIEPDQCLGCAICVDVCPHSALATGRTDLVPRPIPDRCTACSICVRQCPTGAIVLLSSHEETTATSGNKDR